MPLSFSPPCIYRVRASIATDQALTDAIPLWFFVFDNAGTTPERAQETLDVCTAEVERLRDGVSGDELDRAMIGIKSHLVMQGESTAARAAALGHDQFCLGRARSLEERAREIESITLGELNDYLRSRQFSEFTTASIGPVEPRVGLGLEA